MSCLSLPFAVIGAIHIQSVHSWIREPHTKQITSLSDIVGMGWIDTNLMEISGAMGLQQCLVQFSHLPSLDVIDRLVL